VTSKRFSQSVIREVSEILGDPLDFKVDYGNIFGNGNKCATRVELLYYKSHLLDNWKKINVDKISWIYQPYKPYSITYFDSTKWVTEFINSKENGRYENKLNWEDGTLTRAIAEEDKKEFGVLEMTDLEDDEISTSDPRCQ